MGLKVELLDDILENKMILVLLEDMEYKFTTQKEVINLRIKSGFECDGASIPKKLWGLIGSPLSGKYRRAAIVHDALYATHKLDRKKADDMFYNIMRADGVGFFKANAMYAAVRAFGSAAWNDNLRDSHNWGSFVGVKYASNSL